MTSHVIASLAKQSYNKKQFHELGLLRRKFIYEAE